MKSNMQVQRKSAGDAGGAGAPMTPERLARFRSLCLDGSVIQELVLALETERARLDWLEEHIHDDPEGFRWPCVCLEPSMLQGCSEGVDAYPTVREAIDSRRPKDAAG